MASTYSTDLSLELVATGEKSGLWGTITNTNLQILQAASSGYTTLALTSGNTNLSLADGSDSANGKKFYIKLTGTLTANCTVTMPATTTGGNANRVFIIQDATSRTTANYTIGILTTGQATPVKVPVKSTLLLVLAYSKLFLYCNIFNREFHTSIRRDHFRYFSNFFP